jgi:hypothetical protein
MLVKRSCNRILQLSGHETAMLAGSRLSESVASIEQDEERMVGAGFPLVVAVDLVEPELDVGDFAGRWR